MFVSRHWGICLCLTHITMKGKASVHSPVLTPSYIPPSFASLLFSRLWASVLAFQARGREFALKQHSTDVCMCLCVCERKREGIPIVLVTHSKLNLTLPCCDKLNHIGYKIEKFCMNQSTSVCIEGYVCVKGVCLRGKLVHHCHSIMNVTCVQVFKMQLNRS